MLRWLNEHGVTSSYEDYLALPIGVLDDCGLLIEADVKRAEWEAARNGH